MTQEPTVVHSEPEPDSTKHVVHLLMQFALAVRHRKNVVIVALAVSALLSGLYYATATRYYEANAHIVLQIDTDTWSPGMAMQQGMQQSLLPTYQALITCQKVIQGAVDRLPREARIDFARARRDHWDEIIASKLSVDEKRQTNIVKVGFRSKDPHAAVAVVNAVVESYQEYMDKNYRGRARELIDVLTDEKVKLEAKLADMETQLEKARRETSDLGISAESKVVHPMVQKAITLGDQLTESQMQRADLECSLATIQSAVYHGEDLQQHLLALMDVVGRELILDRLGLSTQDAEYLNDLERSRFEDQAKLAELEKHFGWAHPRVVGLQNKIQVSHQALQGFRDRVRHRATQIQDSQLGPMLIQMVQQQLKGARQLEVRLQEEYERAETEAINLASQLARLDILRHGNQRLRDQYDVLLNRIDNIDIKDEGQEVRVDPVRLPEVNETPVSPNLARTILIALALGLGSGLAIVYVLDSLDDRFRSMEEMQALLGVPVLAMVRELKTDDAVGVGALQTYVAPNASESEAFRTLRTTLSFADQDTHQIVISSPEPGDGKTTVLANLAVAVAQSGKKTLLIDADLRRPGLTAMMGMRGIDGLSSVIRGEDDIVRMSTAHIRASGLEGLDILPSGPRPANPAELLGSQRFSELLGWAESVYDQIFIDSPPTLATSDTAVIGRLTNAVVLVVQPAKNRRRAVTRCVENFAVLKIPLLGIVVNRIGSEKEGGYYGYGYGGYYGYDYGYGGDSSGDEELSTFEEQAPVEQMVGGAGEGQHWRRDEAHPSGGIVPRRVGRTEHAHGSRD